MATNFIPPIPIGQFKPSSEAIASWLYEVWKYLQENPIPTEGDVAEGAEQAAENYVATNVPPIIAQAISALTYNDFVTGTSLPIYRASNDEIGPEDLLEAWNEGCRIALVDDENVYIMYKDGNTVDLVQVLTEAQSSGVVSVNGQSGIVNIGSTQIPNASNVPGDSVTAALNAINTRINNILSLAYPVGSYYWSSSSTSPATLFGGTWEQIQGRFLFAADNVYTVGQTGGEIEHTLTTDEMPSHRHSIGDLSGRDSGSDWVGEAGISAAQTRSTEYAGGGQAHNNMPPYIVAYCWHRTA